MKKIINLLSLVTILFCSCDSQINENKIIGNWKVIEFDTDTPTLSSGIIDAAKIEALSTQYSFEKDKSFSMKSKIISDGKSGNYKYLSKKKTFQMTYSSDGVKTLQEYQIESLSDDLMKWTQEMGDLGSISMTLKKE